MERISFGVVGAGWRAEFYLRVARALPERFEVAGVVVRNPQKAAPFERRWGVRTFATLDDMLDAASPTFVVTCVTCRANPGVLRSLAERGVPALSETPPAPDLDGLVALNELAEAGARVQVAEQYWLQPHHAAQLALVSRGLLGRVTQAQVSAAHGYHGISLIRRFLGVRWEASTISAKKFVSAVVQGPGRAGPPEEEKVRDSVQEFYWFDFGDRLGLLDFTGDQYFGWIRSERVLVRGERGEITGGRIRYLKDFRTPIRLDLVRHAAGAYGNLEGNYLKGFQAGEEWVYRNPLAPAALSDDEIAVGTCLIEMAEYVRTGKSFYSLAEASQDHYLYLSAQEALRTGEPVRTERQPWAG